jgi:CHAT domain-containing protein/predicted LPLAT superfamily acyltransferase
VDERREKAYLGLIQALLQCEGGQEEALLRAQPDLVDEGLVMALLAVAEILQQQDDPQAAGTIGWLQNFAVQLAQNLGLDLPSELLAAEAEEEAEGSQADLDFLNALIRAEIEDSQQVQQLFAQNISRLTPGLAAVMKWLVARVLESQPEAAEGFAEAIENIAIRLSEFPLGNRAQNLEIVLAGYEAVLLVWTPENDPEKWAGTQNNRANAYSNRIRGDRAENLEAAIAGYEAALQVYTRADFPIDWAMTQNNLASAYSNRIKGDRSDNLEAAIASFYASLQVRTPADFPIQWAMTQNNLANAYSHRIRGDRAENLEAAIASFYASLQVYTRAAFPIDWAMTQNNLATAYSNRIRGDRAENLEAAIASFYASLQVYTLADFPIQWAMTQNNLANAYSHRIRGDRAENLEAAIAGYDASLQVRTRSVFPIDWAMTQNNLANAYSNRIKGDRAENLEAAIAGYDASLQVYTRADFPIQWAMTQNNRANAYSDRIRGDRAENLEAAIAGYQASLQVRTRSVFPIDWASTQNNRATAYLNRIRGDRAEHLEAAIAGYDASLQVYTRADFPIDWAMTQNNRANAYSDRIRGDRAENLEAAIAGYDAALQVRTPEQLPIDCLTTSRNLGNLHFNQGNWLQAIAAYNLAIQAAETSRSWAINEDERQRIVREALSVYENTIQAHINLGQIEEAIETSERARSRQLVDFMATKDLYADAEIPPEVQEYLAEYDRLQKEIDRYRTLGTGDQNTDLTYSDRQLATVRSRAVLEEISITIKDLEAQKQEVWRKIRQLDPTFAAQTQVNPIDFSTIQQLVTDRTAILSFYTTDDHTHIFIITRDKDPQLFTCAGQGWQELQIWLQQSWLTPYTGDRSTWLENMNDVLAELVDRLQIHQLIQQLQGIKELVIIPHLFLHQIPFSALKLSNGKILGDTFTISYAPSCQILQYCIDREASRYENRPQIPILQHGTVENADGTLPGAELEGQHLANLYQIPDEQRLRGPVATRDRFIALLKDQQINHLHFASHGQSRLDNPFANQLTLADGALTLDRLLLSRYPQLSEVFLSCCETHLGTTEITDDLLTLGTGFLCAGARTVLSTLWAVDDLTTVIFCRLYYANRWNNDGPGRAMQKAQTTLRLMSGEEFQKSYSEDFKNHLRAYARANQTDRRNLYSQYAKGEIDEAAYKFQEERSTISFSRIFAMLGSPGKPGSIDRLGQKEHPFAHPFYWAGFTCQGLA